MRFCRSVVLSLFVLGVVWGPASVPPLRAEEAELTTQDAQAQINIRALANTQSDVVGVGTAGDHVQVLSRSRGEEGWTWYRIKVLKSGISGWVRGDLIKVQSAAKPSAAKPSTASVPLVPPRVPASAKSAASPQPSEAKPVATKPEPLKSKPTEAAKPPQPAPSKSEPSEPSSATSASAESPSSTGTVVAFSTSTYAVRVFSEAGQLRMNLYNRKSQQVALKSGPVESKSSKTGTTYTYSGDGNSDLQVVVSVPLEGLPMLTAKALGESLQEQSEAVLQQPKTP
ncbi:MAG TPA: SH3 domain-containing protein [Stenomitos sp.]